MSVEENSFWLLYSIMIIIAFIGFITPFLLKGNILFGSRFPNEIINHPETINLKKNFKQIYMAIFIPFIIIIGLFLSDSPTGIYFNGSIIAEIFLYILIYAVYNRKAKELKKELLSREITRPQKEVLIVDTNFRGGKFLISIWWFLPSLLIIISNIIILLISYKRIPGQITLHFDMQGIANQFVDKSYLHILLAPLGSFIIFCVFIVIYFSIKLSRQEIDSNRPETSKLQDRQFRLLWSEYSVILCTGTVTWMFFVSLHASKLLIIPHDIFRIIIIAFPLLCLIYTMFLAVKTGQSGSRLKLKTNEPDTGMNNVDDDSYWKFGMIYYNPHDPSIFVSKRYGIGWTINMGRPAGTVILISIIAISIIIGIISKK